MTSAPPLPGPRPTSPPARARRLGAGLLLALALAACGGEPEPPRAARVVFVVLDTLRADHLSAYGYERPTSPSLEALCAEGTRFTRCQAAAPWTLPSHASMFTGLYPHEHGARTWPMEALEPLRQRGWAGRNNAAPLEPSYLTLAECLRGAGWATGAVVANAAYMDAHFGVAQGFDHYDHGRARVQGINERALAWVDRHADEPFFLFLNYMDTHRPYNLTPRADIPDRSDDPNLLKRLAPLVLDRAGATPEQLQALTDQYDTAIANLDEGLGELFDALRARGLWEDTLVVVTSDHGEYLGEKDLIEHSKDVYQGALAVPLIVKGPGFDAGAVDEELIGHVHLAGLVVEHAAVEGTALRDARTELMPHWPRGPLYSENHYTRLKDLSSSYGSRFDRVRRVLRDGDLKYIESSDGADELYDLAADPGEEHDLVDDPRRAPMAERLRAFFAGLRAAAEPGLVVLTDEQARTMDQLGYGGGGTDGDDDDPDDDPDDE